MFPESNSNMNKEGERPKSPTQFSGDAAEVRDLVEGILDVLPAHLAILDENGVIIAVNRAWCAFADANELHDPTYGVGSNYFAVCETETGIDAEFARAAYAGLRPVLAGEASSFMLEYPCHSPNTQRWFLLRASDLSRHGKRYAVLLHEDITQRVLAEVQARLVARLPEENPNPVLRIALDGKILYANAPSGAVLEAWGCDAEGNVPQAWCKQFQTAFERHQPLRFEVTRAGRSYRLEAVPVSASNCINVYGYDITEEKQAAQGLAQLAAIVTSSNDAIVSKTLDGIITSWNRGAETMFGYREDEVVGKPITMLIPSEKLGEEAVFVEQIAAGETVQNYDTIRRRKDGSDVLVSVTLSPIQDAEGRVVGASKIARDITERQQAEAAQRRYSERLAAINRLDRLIASNVDLPQIYDRFVQELQAVIPVDRTAIVQISAAGDQWQVTRQWTAHRAANQPGQWVPVQGSVIERLISQRMPFYEAEVGEQGHWPETDILRKEGLHSRLLLPLTVQERVIGVLTAASHQPAAFSEEDQAALVTIADQLAIAIQKANLYAQVQRTAAELEQRVRQRTAELEASNQELEAFSYSVSHDLRSPLRAIDGFSRILLRDYQTLLPDEGQRRLRLVRENAQQMGQLIDDLLAFSRLNRQPLHRQPTPLDQIVKQVLDALSSEREHRQVEWIVGTLPICQADPALLKQVMMNLLSNALKFTRQREIARIEVGIQVLDGDQVYFVKDNGAGFDMRYADKLFGVFQRLHSADEFEGTGVGLALVQRILHRHGGRIWAEAEVDKGAAFYFTLGGKIDDGAE